MISKSGGARMMEAAYSLMQLAKTSVNLLSLLKPNITFHYVLTRRQGTTSSYAMLEISILSLAHWWVCRTTSSKDTAGKDLPEGFRLPEFLGGAWVPRLYSPTKI
jgi:acetyl-CoA carboxylase carboxyl transferase subunit beta